MKFFRSRKEPLPASSQEPMQVDRVAVLSAGHFVNDVYPGFVPPLLPLLMEKIGFGLPLAGALISFMSVFNSLAQPVFGHIADKTKHPYLVVFGPLVTAIFLGCIGVLNSYGMLVLFVIISGLGTAAFHPQSAVYTTRASGRRAGLGMSIFVTGGSAGHALGPIIIIPIVTYLGLQYSLITMIFGILISGFMFLTLPSFEHVPVRQKSASLPKLDFKKHSSLVFLWVIVSVRAFIIVGFITYLPIYLHNKSFSLFISGSAITLFELSGAVGSMIGGSLSDYLGKKRIIVLTLFLSLPCLYLFLQLQGVLAFLMLALAGVFIYGSIPVVIIMAQELYPSRVNTVSSLMMGVSWGVGGLLVTPLGWYADKFGMKSAFMVLIILGVMAAIAAMFLPDTRKHLVNV